ncbi:hypothetical protein C7B62_10070 [Pleurocapsa sp. CCALA 161]|uniref:hypothetical protein n=1 Tax=Pleurocapsa sp. CCALA 161 TaxID=2107688 RepID=UPI000D07CB12|nr:hypothetical protein [Pleurocapsa sp. CCALA 161]PSB10259.1 hypothetical protein C7B62_10070 [Pleurocapsa sp. CCALA 161]
MSHFKIKTLSFYVIAISSVLFLFKIVSTYGETRLNAAADINGSYQFASAENLPDCLQGKQLNLNIEQSGVYLFGNLEVASPGVSPGVYDEREVQPKSSQGKGMKIPFNGSFEDNQIIMSGQGNIANCDSEVQLTVQGQHKNGNLVGQINDHVAKTEGAFLAKSQKSKLPSAESTEGY